LKREGVWGVSKQTGVFVCLGSMLAHTGKGGASVWKGQTGRMGLRCSCVQGPHGSPCQLLLH
jgi:hypothetical protein